MREKKGFTLVELLVAMAIIAILIALAIFGITQALQQSRETGRKNAVDQINKAVILFQSNAQTLPTTISTTTSGSNTIVTVGTGANAQKVQIAGTVVYVAPGSMSGYTVVSSTIAFCYKTGTPNGYALGTKLESGSMFYITTDPCF